MGYPRVGVVILNWLKTDETLACLRSLQASDYPSFEAVVVDNGSPADGPARIRERFPEVTVIENGRNLGFAAGNNVGIAHLLARGVRYVLLLNDDTEVAPDLLSRLVEAGEAEPDAGVLGPKIYYYTRPDVIWSAGGAVDARGEPRHLRLDEADDGAPEAVQDVDYVTGCAILVKREVIERVGPLDERFFIYFEETEWCARARRAGYRVLYVPRARMWHKIPSAHRTRSRRYLYLMTRNRLLYLRCSGAGPGALLGASLDLLRTAASWTLRPEHRAARPYTVALLRGVLDFYRGRFGTPEGAY